jgi:hypothetical protein
LWIAHHGRVKRDGTKENVAVAVAARRADRHRGSQAPAAYRNPSGIDILSAEMAVEQIGGSEATSKT